MEDINKLKADLQADVDGLNAKLDLAATNAKAVENEATGLGAQLATVEDELKTALANAGAAGQVDETQFQGVRDAIAAASTKAQGIADAAGQIAVAINTPGV